MLGGDVRGGGAVGVAHELAAGVDGGRRRQPLRVDVVGAPAEVVVCRPVQVGANDGDLRGGLGWGDDPGEGEEGPRFALGVEVVEAGAFRRCDVLLVVGARVADRVPLDAGLGVVPVGADLDGRARPVLVVPADGSHERLVDAVAPQRELVRLGRVDAKLGELARAHGLGPRVAQQALGQQAELVWLGDG